VNLRAAGRTAEAVPLLKSVLKLQESKFGPFHADTIYSRNALESAYESLGRWADAESLLRDAIASRRKVAEPYSQSLGDDLSWLGDNLLKQSKWSEAELVLCECLAIREKGTPGTWRHFHTMSRLGEAFSGQGRHAEAERLIVGGYEGMKAREATIETRFRHYLLAAEQRLVRFYEEWGKPEQAKKWALKLGLVDLPADVFARP
jgi:hypothetical protein